MGFSPWYLKPAGTLAGKVSSGVARARRSVRAFKVGARKKSIFSRRGRARHKAKFKSGYKWGRRAAYPVAAGAGYLGWRALYPKRRTEETLNYSIGVGDINKMRQVRRLKKGVYGKGVKYATKLIHRTLGPKKAGKFVRGARRMYPYRRHMAVGLAAGAGGVGGVALARRRRRFERAIDIGDIRKASARRIARYMAALGAKAKKTKTIQHLARHKGKYAVGAGAFAAGRATRPTRYQKEKQVIYKPYRPIVPTVDLRTKKASRFSNLGGGSLSAKDKLAKAAKIIEGMKSDERQWALRKRDDYGRLVNMVGKSQAGKLIK